MACANSNQSSNSSSTAGGFDKQGHRGCRGLMPENTIPAMLEAIDMGVTTLELDVVVTKDKKINSFSRAIFQSRDHHKARWKLCFRNRRKIAEHLPDEL